MTRAISTENLARICARRPRLTIGAWLVALIVSVALTVNLLGDALTTDSDFTGTPDSKAAELLINERLETTNFVSDIVLVRSSTQTVDDPGFEQAVAMLAGDLGEFGSVSTFYQSADAALVSADRDTTIINVVLSDDSEEHVNGFVATAQSLDGVDGFETAVTGVNVVDVDFSTVAEEDLQKGELIGVGVAMLVLILVFGAIVASVVPLLLAIVSIAVALGLTALVGSAFELSFFVVNMLVMMGLAVGIDYALFIVSRFREERARGLDKIDAIGVAGSTANRAVFFSGVTVVLALIGMLIVPTTIFKSLAIGAILVVFVSVIAALTLLPAVLQRDRRQDRQACGSPSVVGRAPTSHERGIWAAIARGSGAAARRSASWLGVAIMDRRRFPAHRHQYRLRGGRHTAREVRLEAGLRPARRGVQPSHRPSRCRSWSTATCARCPSRPRSADLQATLAADGRFGIGEPITNPAGDLTLLEVPILGGASSSEAVDAVRDLRETYVPASFPTGTANVVVGGTTAENVDFFDITNQYLPIVFAFVSGSASCCSQWRFARSSFRSSRSS